MATHMLKQQLQKTEEEFEQLSRELNLREETVSGIDEQAMALNFIRQAQIKAVKAFADELQPFLYEYPGTDEKENGHNSAVQEIKQAINNLLKDI